MTTTPIMSEFNQETECLNRLFLRQIRSASYTVSMNIEFMREMPFYMRNIVDIYCYDCCYIIILNKYLHRWRDYINNTNNLIHHIDDMRHKISQSKQILTDRVELMSDEPHWHLCGCSNVDKEIDENAEYENYLRMKTLDEKFEEEYKERISWRTNYYKYLYELDQHLHYFKTIPHKIYRDNILFELMSATNVDCVKKIIEYL